MNRIRDTLFVIGVLLGMSIAVEKLCGCLSREAKEAAAEGTYLSQQLQCVDNLETKADIDGCRASVKARWAKDAGK